MKKWKTWQKVVLWILIIGNSYWAFARIRRYRREAAIKRRAEARLLKPKQTVAVSKDPDDRVVLKEEHPTTLQDEKNLKGRTLWVSAGGQMEFYSYNGKTVDLSHPAGVLLGAETIEVRDAVEQTVSKSIGSRFPEADAEILLIFTRPGDAKNPNKEYGVAVGDREGRDYNLLTDQLFFYDDPHRLYAYWGPKVWQAIDSHTAIVGMTEHQMQLALGQVSTPRGDIMGDQSVEFDDQGKPKLVTFSNGKAIEIRDESQ